MVVHGYGRKKVYLSSDGKVGAYVTNYTAGPSAGKADVSLMHGIRAVS